MSTSSIKPPIWYWVVCIIALVWNSFGVMAYLAKAFVTEDMINALPKDQQAELLVEFPAWYTAAFAFAVFFGALGSLALLIRKKWALPLLIVSALGAIIQHCYLFITVALDGGAIVMPIMVIVVCLFLVWLAKYSISKNWLN